MLFAQQNGLSRPAMDDSEVDVLQNIACGIGPRVDGIAASLALPQAMGGFITQGAAGACGGRGQQSEQHTPTTVRNGLGETAPTTFTTVKLAIDPAKLALVKATAMPITQLQPIATKAEVPSAPPPEWTTTPASTPAAPDATSYPPGTITAFSVATNMWRVAVPTVASGFGMFGAAAPFTELAPVQAPPPGATQVSETQLLKQTGQLPLYKKWQFWAAIGGGVVVLGTGTVLLFRRKRT